MSLKSDQLEILFGVVVSEKIRFEFLYVHNLGPRSRNEVIKVNVIRSRSLQDHHLN